MNTPNPGQCLPEGRQPDGEGATVLPVSSSPEQQQRAEEAILCETNSGYLP